MTKLEGSEMPGSGGRAAAVAAGDVKVALGGDQAGSIRIVS
jgi:Asp-tRNA(Asn)/Glu-tRNA(Gln) amidotransferase A subunit family amidase